MASIVSCLWLDFEEVRDCEAARPLLNSEFTTFRARGGTTARTLKTAWWPGLDLSLRTVTRIVLRHWVEAAQIAALAVVAVAVTWPAAFEPSLLPAMFSWSDILVSHWPSSALIADSVANGQGLPLWNPYYGGGRPVAADPLAALFYPATHLVHHLPLRDYFLLTTLLHLIWAGVGTLVLSRVSLHLSGPGSFVTALAFMASPRMIGHLGAGHLTLIQTVSWYPWVALAFWLTVRRPGPWWPLASLSLAMLFLAGHPQMVYYAIFLLLPATIWQMMSVWRSRGLRPVLLSGTGLGAAVAVALAIASVHLLPTMEFAANSTRKAVMASTDRVPLVPLLQAIAGLRVPWEQHENGVLHEVIFDPGIAVLVLALAGIAARPRLGVALAGGVVFLGAFSMGIASPLFTNAFEWLPGFDRWFRGVARIWFVATVAIALLAGLGVDGLLALARRRWPHTNRLAAVALACVVVSLLYSNQGLARVGPLEQHVNPNRSEGLAATAAGGGRVYGVQRNVRQLSAVTLDVELADGQDPLLIEPYATFMQRAGGYGADGYVLAIPAGAGKPDPALLGLLDVRAVVSSEPLVDPSLTAQTSADGVNIYLNPLARGRVFLVDGLPGASSTLDSLDFVNAFVSVRQTRERISASFNSPSEALAVIAVPAYPGWHAQLDGRPVEPQTIEGVLPAVPVDAGPHHLVYSYSPVSVQIGAAISLVGLGIVLGWLVCFQAIVRWRGNGKANDVHL